VTLERDGALATLRLDNPTKRNAITGAMWRQIPKLLDELADVRVVVLCGAGAQFCAGADLDELVGLQENSQAAAEFRQEMQTALHALAQFPAPTIAQISGNCYGAGVALAMACDLRFAEADARICIPPAKLGLVYPKEDVARLVALVGPGQAKHLLFSASELNPKQAARIGLINAVQHRDKTLALVDEIIGNSAHSIVVLKSMIDGRLDNPDQAFDDCFGQKDFAVITHAFAHKSRAE